MDLTKWSLDGPRASKMESEGWKMEPRVAKVERGKSRMYEDRPPYRSGSIVSVAQIY